MGGRSRKLVRLSSISSMNKTGSPDSGSAHEPRYWMTLGCRRPLRNSISRWKRSTMRWAAGSRVWKRIGCRTLAAQTSWSHLARYTAPYDPIPSELSSDLTSRTSRKPKRLRHCLSSDNVTCAQFTSRAPSLLYSPTQPSSESASVNIRTLRFCSYAHLWNISCCSEIQCRIGTSQKAWRSAQRFPLAASVKSNISACAYRGQEC